MPGHRGDGAIGCIANLIVGVSGVTVIDDEAVVGDVPPAGTKLSDEPFLISLDTSLADGSLTTFDLVVIDADDA